MVEITYKILLTIILISTAIAITGCALIADGLKELGARMYVGGGISVLLSLLVILILYVWEEY